jgi:metal-sulfur cluster biosynthetic enzyme
MNTATVAEVLAGVYDPELAIDIVALGLVYGIEIEGDTVAVTITTTSPACPMSDALYGMTEAVLAQSLPGKRVHVELTFEPPWQIGMADRSALEELGLVPARA